MRSWAPPGVVERETVAEARRSRGALPWVVGGLVLVVAAGAGVVLWRRWRA